SRSVLPVARSRWQAGRGLDGRRMARPLSARFRPKRKNPDAMAGVLVSLAEGKILDMAKSCTQPCGKSSGFFHLVNYRRHWAERHPIDVLAALKTALNDRLPVARPCA